MAVKFQPDGYHTATPYLIIRGAAAAIEFYKKAFDATELMRFAGPDGKVGHAEIKIGDSILMMADEHPDMGFRGPSSLGGSSVGLMLYVKDVDAQFNKAIAAGGKVVKPVQDQFYGDRSGTLTDPFGHVWTISTHVKDLTPEELQKAAQQCGLILHYEPRLSEHQEKLATDEHRSTQMRIKRASDRPNDLRFFSHLIDLCLSVFICGSLF